MMMPSKRKYNQINTKKDAIARNHFVLKDIASVFTLGSSAADCASALIVKIKLEIQTIWNKKTICNYFRYHIF